MTNEYRYLGYGITDRNGVAILDHDQNGNPLNHSYTGVGEGVVDFIASTDNPIEEGSLLSQNIEIVDYIGIDNGTSDNHNDNIWTPSEIVSQKFNRGSEYTTFNSTSVSNVYIPISEDVCIEFDIMANTDYSNSRLITIRNGTSILLSVVRNDLVISQSAFSHIKLEIIDNSCTVTNTDNQRSVTGSVTGFNRFYLRVGADETLQFKNLKYYPL